MTLANLALRIQATETRFMRRVALEVARSQREYRTELNALYDELSDLKKMTSDEFGDLIEALSSIAGFTTEDICELLPKQLGQYRQWGRSVHEPSGAAILTGAKFIVDWLRSDYFIQTPAEVGNRYTIGLEDLSPRFLYEHLGINLPKSMRLDAEVVSLFGNELSDWVIRELRTFGIVTISDLVEFENKSSKRNDRFAWMSRPLIDRLQDIQTFGPAEAQEILDSMRKCGISGEQVR